MTCPPSIISFIARNVMQSALQLPIEELKVYLKQSTISITNII